MLDLILNKFAIFYGDPEICAVITVRMVKLDVNGKLAAMVGNGLFTSNLDGYNLVKLHIMCFSACAKD